jgi:hypothetical protein
MDRVEVFRLPVVLAAVFWATVRISSRCREPSGRFVRGDIAGHPPRLGGSIASAQFAVVEK